MGYFQVRYDFRVVNYNRRGFIRLATASVALKVCERTKVPFNFVTSVHCIIGKRATSNNIICVQSNLAYFPCKHCPLMTN